MGRSHDEKPIPTAKAAAEMPAWYDEANPEDDMANKAPPPRAEPPARKKPEPKRPGGGAGGGGGRMQGNDEVVVGSKAGGRGGGAAGGGGVAARLAAEASKPKVSGQFGAGANEDWEIAFVERVKEVAVGAVLSS